VIASGNGRVRTSWTQNTSADVQPGEIVIIDHSSLESGEVTSLRIERPAGAAEHHCIFEYIYFRARQPGFSATASTRSARKLRQEPREGRSRSERRNPDDKLIVINVPDSSNTATMGYVQETIKLGGKAEAGEFGLIRSHYIGRTFIQPNQESARTR